jgi:dye decolorizing peroxidase
MPVGGSALASGNSETGAEQPEADSGQATEPFHGEHQAGVETPLQAHSVFIALDLAQGSTTADLARLMRLWTSDAERLAQGQPALADTEPELAEIPARLTATVGFGPGVFEIKGLAPKRPEWLKPLPPFSIDKLQDRYSGGDLLLHLGSDDPITLAHAQRMMVKDSTSFAKVRWLQSGFHRAAANSPQGVTGRNLMGQVDGTVNPAPGTTEFSDSIWISDGPSWIVGGTGMILRRIRMKMDGWDSLSREEKELALGRGLDNGAPLTGDEEHDTPDFSATHNNGLPVIPEFAHIRAAAGTQSKARFLRRPFNYDDGFLPNGGPDLGLLFAAYAADITGQIVPVQRRLAERDLLNTWTTPIGSAVFAIPPGCTAGGTIGETLLG